MTPTHQNWGAEALWQELEPLLPGLSVEVVARLDSTNTALLERIRAEAHAVADTHQGRRAQDLQPSLLVAEHQTHGRGRMGRSWHALPGASLTFSLGLPLSLDDWSGLSLVVGCAIAEGLEPAPSGTPRLQLKWPNDIWLDGRKLGGILIETVPAGALRMAVIGVGLNITPEAFDASRSFQTGFACIDEFEPGLGAPQVLARIARPLIQGLLDFQAHGFQAWRERYARRDLLLDRDISSAQLEGRGAGVNERGELLLRNAAGLHPVVGGEVSVRLINPALD
ncbi:MAG: biotin--[acetyl-CoA-carboxylase] ligase [Burkholderiaceae bacterium]|nr:biotin--[acetyl-CoA-carboxylase] ligase [Burkholderiaceae bacterium]